ncbi:unnamed protein product [Effrenium voratum]|nr:unnamed protein product [Effrenium voratum]
MSSTALWLSQAPRGFVSAALPSDLCVSRADQSLVAMNSESEGRKWRGASRYPRYQGYVYKRKKLPGIRLRMNRWGIKHNPIFRINAAPNRLLGPKTGRFLEICGWFDPKREIEDPKMFRLSADRCVHWLRNGANPTNQVANLLDLAGIIRRTGQFCELGEWEWRIDPMSGPEAPEGWSYDGPQTVSWGNKPCVHRYKGKGPNDLERIRNTPLIERYGFRGYKRIPIDEVALGDPLSKSAILDSFPNTELPVFE